MSIVSQLNHNRGFILEMLLRVRRNHALEHATLHVLSQRKPQTSLAGQSDFGGFWILGDVSTAEVKASVEEALTRLKGGESRLAVHPFCGTNLLASAILGSLAAMSAFLGSGKRLRDKVERLPFAISLVALSMVFARPLGGWLQRNVTTSGEVGGMKIRSVRAMRGRWLRTHRISTEFEA